MDGRDTAGVTTSRARSSGRPRLPSAREQLMAFLELLVLTGFVVAQPLLDVLGRSPDVLLFRQADPRDIALLAVALTLVPPLLLGAVEALAGLFGRRAHRLVHLVIVAALLGLLVLELAKRLTPLRGPVLVVSSGLAGVGGGLVYARAGAVRRWLRWLWPAPIAFLLIFLLLSPAAELLRSPGAGGAAQGASGNGRQGPIVMVLMDEFPLTSLLDRRGRIDRRLYPNFARLAGESTWYRNATGVSGLSNWAVPAMFTGRYPAEDRLPIASQYPGNLFTLLGSHRYKLRVFEGTSQLCPPSTCPDAKRPGRDEGLPAQDPGDQGGLRGVLRDAARVWARLASPRERSRDPVAGLQQATGDAAAGPAASADPTRRASIVKGFTRGIGFERFLSSIRPTGPDERALYFAHVLIPHQPWKYLPSGRKYPERALDPGGLAGGRWPSEPWPVQSAHQRHLMQTAIADRMLGDLVKRLQATGLYDRSLLVVTADHGMAFKPGEQGRASVSDRTAADVLWVPLFIKRPGQRAPSTTDVNWEHVDLLPTIAGLVGVGVPWPTEGVSWADPSVAGRARSQKWFYPLPGDRRVLEGPANQALALRGVTDRVLRPQDGYLGWFMTGRRGDLVGRRVDELPVAGGGGLARVIGLDDYRRVDLRRGTVPAHVAGRLVKTTPGVPPGGVVVAVNGVIGGVSETFALGGSRPTWFTAMVPDSLMRQGDNRLQLFAVDLARGRPRLHPLGLTR